MAEGDESWVMVVLGTDVGGVGGGGVAPNFASFFVTRSFHCSHGRVFLSVFPPLSTAWRSRGAGLSPPLTPPLGRPSIRMRLRPLEEEGRSCHNQPTRKIDQPASVQPSGGRTQPESQAINGLQVLSPQSPPPPPVSRQLKTIVMGLLTRKICVEAVCILANTAHNAEDCLAVEELISCKHGWKRASAAAAGCRSRRSTMECGHLGVFEMKRDVVPARSRKRAAEV